MRSLQAKSTTSCEWAQNIPRETRCGPIRNRKRLVRRDESPPGRHTAPAPQHFLYFFPLPHGHGSLRPTLGVLRTIVLTFAPSPCVCAAASWVSPAAGTATVSPTPYPPEASCVAAVT